MASASRRSVDRSLARRAGRGAAPHPARCQLSTPAGRRRAAGWETPRHALLSLGARTLYLQGEDAGGNVRRRKELFSWARREGKRLMISEGQAEPWEAVTVPPSPPGHSMYSCTPELVIENYNRCIGWAREANFELDAYLFWGAEYWITRERSGDSRYLDAVARILSES